MKRFQWPLQRVLDLKIKQQQAVRARLGALAAEMHQVRRQMAQRRRMLEQMLVDMGSQPIAERIAHQAVFWECCAKGDRLLAAMQEQLVHLEAKRQEKMREYLDLKRERETLEKLRSEAVDQYRRDVDRAEQVQLDESASMAFVRRGAVAEDIRG